ncbi:MAG: two-component system, OmpR family, phosphate regulon sensor histidine kinase PhoR [Clostridia bacterium]|nr:two-component system, OmpR family, phosphate regulon sensor histidine kinase PhoR [Clostridia bacterium]
MRYLHSLRWKIVTKIIIVLLFTFIAASFYIHELVLDLLINSSSMGPVEINNVISELDIHLIIITLMTLVIVGIGTFIMTGEIIKPLKSLLPLTKKIASGDLEQRIDIKTNDEIGILASHLNIMVETLRNNFRQIAEGRNKVEAILSSMTDALIAVDQVGRVILLNPAAEDLFGKNNQMVKNKYLLEVIRHHKVDEVTQEILSSGRSIETQIRLFHTTEQTFRLTGTPVTSEQGRVIGAVLTFRDITNIIRLEQMRKEFVANVSHELRTPMTSIKGFTETLLEGSLEDKEVTRRFLGIINKEAERLQKLIEDLLQLSRLDNKRRNINPGKANLSLTLEKVLTTVRKLAEDKNITLEVEVPEELPELAINESYLAEVLMNLIDNAIKYTENGGKVKIKASSENNEVLVQVQDTGIGIPPESLPRIFERFYRVDKARSRESGGTGLGLSIVKHIIETHNGTVNVTSELEQGSVFSFILPISD